MTLTTLALYQRSSWLFKACPCRPALEGLPPSLVQLLHNLSPLKDFRCAPAAHSRPHSALSVRQASFPVDASPISCPKGADIGWQVTVRLHRLAESLSVFLCRRRSFFVFRPCLLLLPGP